MRSTRLRARPSGGFGDMGVPWRKLAIKLGKWLVRKGQEEALKELQKRKERGQ